ncbi:MAG: hypothetical protein KDK25_03540, partial [Leptospiraceae bacterium]|nr:hypothetical protein [Leptospiraceae bacterium]
PLRDDSLALRFAPIIVAGKQDAPTEMLYRLSQDASGNIHIAYFIVWESEINPAEGWGPFFSRWLYTGGLSLQKILFGPGDVEVIVMELAPSGSAEGQGYALRGLSFETAINYDPRAFGVQHHTVRLKSLSPERLVPSAQQIDSTFRLALDKHANGSATPSPGDDAEKGTAEVHVELPLRFRVMSWNHMFQLVPNGTSSTGPMTGESTAASLPGIISRESVPSSYREFRPGPAYFGQERWDHYRIFKPTESLLARNRAHPLFAREWVESSGP